MSVFYAKKLSLKCFILLLSALFLFTPVSYAASSLPFDVDAKSALLMDAATGTVLYAKNENAPLPPASVTKIMTLLLVMEAIDNGTLTLDEKLCASEHAASMGGSQIYLKVGEEMTVEDLIKSVVISSANDAAVVLAERVGGSEEAFVAKMNERAAELGMTNTHFENTNGLDDDVTNHVTSAMDIAIMSRELLSHTLITSYSSIWMDTIREGAFGLTNTNRLIRFYSGATGLKTGSTSKAGFCISATAKRGEMHLIAVIMGSETRDSRNEAAKKLLDYGFASYSLYQDAGGSTEPIHILGGVSNECTGSFSSLSLILPKGKEKQVTREIFVPDNLTAPVKAGDIIGKAIYSLDGDVIAESNITADQDIAKISYFPYLLRILKKMCFR